MLLFGSEVRSYRDLPMRIHEQSVLHRMEASGVLSGLTRVREFIMDDAHIFLREDQIGEEVERLLRLVQRVYDDFQLTPEMTLSTRPAEFLGEIATWNHAESELKRALEGAGQVYTVDPIPCRTVGTDDGEGGGVGAKSTRRRIEPICYELPPAFSQYSLRRETYSLYCSMETCGGV
jgi:hypothetical protein